MGASLAMVALLLLWLRWRQSARKGGLAGSSPAAMLATSLLGSTAAAASAPRKQAAYEPHRPAAPVWDDQDGATDLLATCRKLEHALRSAEESNDQAKAFQLRRVLRRLYAALECLSGHETPETSDLRAQQASYRRHRANTVATATATGDEARHAPATAAAAAATTVASTTVAAPTAANLAEKSAAAHRRDYVADDVASVTSELFFDVEEGAESDDMVVGRLEALTSVPPATAASAASTATVSPDDTEPALSIYEAARRMALNNEISCRKNRVEETGCVNQTDFLARLHCVRQATQALLADPARRRWVGDTGRDMISAILVRAKVDVRPFHTAWDQLVAFLEQQARDGSGKVIAEELAGRGCMHITLFDAVIDFVLLDAFDDMKRLPPSVASVLANTWIPRTVKERTLSAAIWSVIRTRKGMAAPAGLMVRFYGVMEHVSPILACGLLGCHSVESLEPTMVAFKDLVLEQTVAMFNFDRDKCTTLPDLIAHVDGVLEASSKRAALVLSR